MICCEAPNDATTREMFEEHKLVGSVRETVATDVRGGLFPYVHKYQEWNRPTFTHTKRIMHRWWRNGVEHATWHYVNDE